MTELAIPLQQIARCFEAVIPSIVTTCSRAGVPNVMSVSYVRLVDDRHVALSRQFFRKTHANLLENPRAQLVLQDSTSREMYRLDVVFDHEETSGPLFELMSARVDAVAAMTGMAGVFRLQAACIMEVIAVERVSGVIHGDIRPARPEAGIAAIDSMTQLRLLRRISDCMRSIDDAETLIDSVLGILDDVLGFHHSMLLVVDETGERLYALASRGYPHSGVGAEVGLGDGFIGIVAQTRQLLRVSSLDRDRVYARALQTSSDASALDIPLPALADAESRLAIPLVLKGELLGVLAFESRNRMCYGERDEAFLDIVAGHIALGLHALTRSEPEPREAQAAKPRTLADARVVRHFVFYPHDDCVFVDGQYLIRNVPGRILWKLLCAYAKERRVEFSNRELRLDPALGLPAVRDNLESRLILLRKRLAERCSDVRIVPTERGRFMLDVRCTIELAEKR